MTLMAERSKFQFRMRDLLWAMSLIGGGAGIVVGAKSFRGMVA
jgi:uncharacterized membrane protein YsdA (DUF1294 family)